MRVLYVEDDEMSVRLVAAVLGRRGGCELFSARTGRVGLRPTGAKRPDLVLLDLDLPGETVLRRLGGAPPGAGVLVVVVSAGARAATAVRVLAAGTAHLLAKPLELDWWLAAAAAAFSGRKQAS